MIVTRGLEAFYRFEGNANDSSGNGRNGTVSGATLTTGKFGQAYSFDGVDDYISLTDTTNVFAPNAFTISAWVNQTEIKNNAGVVTKWFAVTGVNQRSIRLDTGTESGGVYRLLVSSDGTATTNRALSFSNATPMGTWTHISASYNGSTGVMRTYINGQQTNSETFSAGAPFNSGEPLDIGLTRQNDHYFNGLIDEVAFFSRALSAGDIRRCMLGMHPF
jgi:hypothetical protein